MEVLTFEALPSRLREKIERTETCWLWTAADDSKGYGRVWWQGKVRCATHVIYRLMVGPIPAGLEIRHSCDNPPCVNPQHLLPGTRAQNMQDCVERGRLNSHNTNKTRCVNGHEFTTENTGNYAGRRYCRKCNTDRARQKRAKSRSNR